MDNEKCHPTTTGGNSTITNGNEQPVLDDCVLIPTRTEGMQDSEAH